MRIEVTQADIDAGKQKDCHACPVAVAINRHIPDAKARVDHYLISARVGKGRVIVTTPSQAEFFIRRFDDGYKPRPFHFDLNVEVAHG